MKTKGLICRGRVRAIEDAVEAWKSDHDEAMAVRDLEDLIRECLWARDLLTEWIEDAWNGLRAGGLSCVQDTGESLRMVLANFLKVVRATGQLVTNYERKGYQIEHSSEFAGIEKQVREMATKLSRDWPFVDLQVMEESRLAYERGECQSVEDVLRELQGADSTKD